MDNKSKSITSCKGKKMNRNVKALVQILGISTLVLAGSAYAADRRDNEPEKVGEVLFKIHDVVPEKNADGKVLYCNVGATFFNRTNIDLANVALTLKWNDDVIGEIIDQEERAAREQERTNPRASRSRYTTAGTTGRTVSTSIKLPPLKSMQQVSLKTKVDTDRCFILLNDMDITVNNCGTATINGRVSQQGCNNLFQYVSPKMAEYYMEFKEVSPEEQAAIEDAEMDDMQKEINASFDTTVAAIKAITDEKSAETNSEDKTGKNKEKAK